MKNRRLCLFDKILFLLLSIILIENLSCQKEKKELIESKKNNPPIITSVTILPEKPDIESELSAVIRSEDPDGDPITYYFQWIKNDEEILGENKSTLSKGKFKKGDLISIKVTPSDGKSNGKAFISLPVKILNSPPVIEKVWIEPKVAYVTDNLTINIKSYDKDGDFIYYTYRWEKNGVEMSDEKSEVLGKGKFKKGDSITVTVIPDDREAIGNPKKSDPVVISNSPPIIVSSPPTSVSGMSYTYQVRAEDPDQDKITFNLKAAPKGMVIEKDTGLIKWQLSKDLKGSHLVEIEAVDNEGAQSLQRYTLNLDFITKSLK